MDVFRPYILVDIDRDAYFEANATRSQRKEWPLASDLTCRMVLSSLRTNPESWNIHIHPFLTTFHERSLGFEIEVYTESFKVKEIDGFTLLERYEPDISNDLVKILTLRRIQSQES